MKSIVKSAKTVEEAIELGLKEIGLSRSDAEVEIMQESTKGLFGIFGGSDAIVKIKEKTKMKIDIDDIFDESKKNIEEEIDEITEESPIILDEKSSELEVKSEEETEVVEIDNEYLNAEKSEENIEEVAEDTKSKLSKMLSKMHIDCEISYEIKKDNIISLNLDQISESDTGIVIGSRGETLDSLQYILSLLVNKNSQKYYRITIDVANYRERRNKSVEINAQKAAYKVLKTKKSIALRPMNSYERRIVHYTLQNYKGVETVSTGKFPDRKVVIKYIEN